MYLCKCLMWRRNNKAKREIGLPIRETKLSRWHHLINLLYHLNCVILLSLISKVAFLNYNFGLLRTAVVGLYETLHPYKNVILSLCLHNALTNRKQQ